MRITRYFNAELLSTNFTSIDQMKDHLDLVYKQLLARVHKELGKENLQINRVFLDMDDELGINVEKALSEEEMKAREIAKHSKEIELLTKKL